MTLKIFSNNIPYKESREAVEQAVREGIGERADAGAWSVSIFEPQLRHRYTITIEGPNQFNWWRTFEGPDEKVPDYPDWAARRETVAGWSRELSARRGDLGLSEVRLVYYPNVGRNNADLPGGLEQIFDSYRILIAPTEFSATAPL